MTSAPRTPPRFVPTLTTVVDLHPAAESQQGASEACRDPVLPSAGPMLEQARHLELPAPQPAAMEPVPPRTSPDMVALTEADAFRIEEELLHRVLQRVDFSLEERLTEAVSAAVQQQLDAMLPRLRGEIETVLRTLVIEALAQELSDNTGSTPGLGAPSLG